MLAGAIKTQSACASIGTIGAIIAGITAYGILEWVCHISCASVLASTVETESAGPGIGAITGIVASITALLGGDGTDESKGGQGNNEDLSHLTI